MLSYQNYNYTLKCIQIKIITIQNEWVLTASKLSMGNFGGLVKQKMPFNWPSYNLQEYFIYPSTALVDYEIQKSRQIHLLKMRIMKWIF